jgi:hypothetical protein
MNSRVLLAALAGTVVYFVYGFVSEGLVIRKEFAPYSAVYRSPESLKPVMPIGLLATFVAILVMACMYAKGYEGGGPSEGLRFGALVAVFVVCTVVAHSYVILNIGGRLAAALAVSNLIQWTLVGLVISLVYGRGAIGHAAR